MIRDPRGRRVRLLDRYRVVHFRRRGIVDEDYRGMRPVGELTDEAIMSVRVAAHSPATVKVHHDWQRRQPVVGSDDAKRQLASIDAGDRVVLDLDWELLHGAGLYACEHAARVCNRPPGEASIAMNATVPGSRAGRAVACIACFVMVCSNGLAMLSRENTRSSASS
jgi:hypothetical protein